MLGGTVGNYSSDEVAGSSRVARHRLHGCSHRTCHGQSRRTSRPRWSQRRPFSMIVLPRCSPTLSKPVAHSAPVGCRHSTRLLWCLCTGDAVMWRAADHPIPTSRCDELPDLLHNLGACIWCAGHVASLVGHLPPVLGAGLLGLHHQRDQLQSPLLF